MMAWRYAIGRSGQSRLACERGLLVLGCLTAGIYGASIAQSRLYQAEAARAFDRAIGERGAAGSPQAPLSRDILTASIIDMSEWSPAKISRYEGRRGLPSPPPLARLRIPSLGLSAMVLEGTDETSLLLGIGHIDGTSRPGEDGNVGLAGHRDSFFRSLSRIALGSEIVLTTLDGDRCYTVDSIEIVGPEKVGILDPVDSPRLTLVTCYPFYFVGPAPLRYVVTATLQEGPTAEMAGQGVRRP
jgi:sortase A